MVGINMEMPTCCVTYTSENDNYTACPFYKICEQRETIKTNYKPTDCPLVEIGTCKDCAKGHKYKNIDECFCDYLQDDIDTDFYCADFEKRGDKNDSN